MNSLPLSPSVLRTQLEAAARLGQEQEARFVALRLQAPPGLGLRLLESQISEFSCYWSHRRGESTGTYPNAVVGIGCAVSHRLEGKNRFEAAQSRMAASFAEVLLSEELQSDVRFFGGAAFSAGRDGSGSCWADFGDASFFLPRLHYIDDAWGARLIVLVEVGELDETQRLIESVYAGFDRDVAPSQGPLFALSRTESTDAATWARLLGGIQELFEHGEVRKVVAARRVTVQLSRAPRLGEVLQRLDVLAPTCTHFALRLGKKTFLGATPELLVDKQGERLETEALAGSISRDVENAEAELLGSAKDQAEHAFVVDSIRSQLERICDQVETAERPQVRHLSRILHLRTPIFAHLGKEAHVLDVVELLHPTPAVGGVPQQEAISWITHNEPTERGWYASPFGWVNHSGDGQFVVALRSALLHGDKVHAYAGAGIVAQSDASLEFAETELKLTSMLGALGVGG